MALRGQLYVASDKSMTHRAIMLASLAKGRSIISKPLLAQDCLSTIACFEQLGVVFTITEEQLIVDSPGQQFFNEPHQVLDTGNSGTTTRLMAGILAGLPLFTVLSGDASIAKRPMDRVIMPLLQLGAKIKGAANNRYTPLVIEGKALIGQDIQMTVASAQVKSALMFAALYAKGTTRITEQVMTRNHSETMFQHFGIEVNIDQLTIAIAGGQQPQATNFIVPGDISSAAFFIVAALITPGSDIILKSVGVNPTRNGIIKIVQRMGGQIELLNYQANNEPIADIRVKYSPHLKATTIEGQEIPTLIDEIPVIALLATQAQGRTIIKDAQELKVKESDRIATISQELAKIGARILPTADGLMIEGKTSLIGKETTSSHGDHRIGMTLMVARLISKYDFKIDDEQAMSISYPQFDKDLAQLGGITS